MRHMTMHVALTFAILAIGQTSARAGINLIVNGDFETVSHVQGTVNGVFLDEMVVPQWDGFPSIPGWTVSPGSPGWWIEIQASTIVGAHSATKYMEVDEPNNPISQTVNLTAGQLYRLSYFYHPRTSFLVDNAIDVSVNGILPFPLLVSDSSDPPDTGWNEYSAHFTPTETKPYVVTFVASQGSDVGSFWGLGGFVDDVSLSPVVIPEPASVVLWSVLGGLGLTFGWRRRRWAA